MSERRAGNDLVRAAMAAPYLGREEECELAVSWKENKDREALHRIATAHMRLVISVAARFRNYGLPMQDLIQEGHVGLLEAAARFEPDRCVRFSTYAAWWIRASVQDYILRNWSVVRGGTSSAQKTLFFNLRRMRAKLWRGNANVPESAVHEKIAMAIGVNVRDVAAMDARLSGADASLNAPVLEALGSGVDRIDFLESDDPPPDEQAAAVIDGERWSEWIRSALGGLSAREEKIVRERRLSEDGATLESLGARLGISKERVRQIEKRALEKMKVALERHSLEIAGM